MRKPKGYIASRISEPSTHAGIAAISQALGFFFPQYAVIANAATVLFGAVAAMRSDKQNGSNREQ